MTGNYIGNNPNSLDVVLSDSYETNNSHLIASTKCVYNAVQEILSQMLTGDPWSLFPPKIPVAIDGVIFGGSDGRRAIMPGERVAREDWILCDGGSDGKGGTVPDLRGRMILGASSTYAAGSTGGSETHTHSISGTIGATTLTVEQMPSHTHGYRKVTSWNGWNGKNDGNDCKPPKDGQPTDATGGSQSHTHTLSGVKTGSASTLPPYYALAYIMRIA